MKTKYILLTAIMFMCCINVFGQTANNISLNNTQAVVLKIEALETATQEQISDLHKENQVLKEQLHKMESEIALYREDVRTETSRMNTNMADWLTILTIGRFYKFNLPLANSQNLFKATTNVILWLQS